MNRRTMLLYGGGILVVLLFAAVLSNFASDNPDGLEFVAEQEGFAETAEDHTLSDTPLADYGENLGGSDSVNTAIAGVAGVLVTLLIVFGLFWMVRRRGPDEGEPKAAG